MEEKKLFIFDKVLHLVNQLLESLVLLKQNCNIHLDIKPDNILFTKVEQPFLIQDIYFYSLHDLISDFEIKEVTHEQIGCYRRTQDKDIHKQNLLSLTWSKLKECSYQGILNTLDSIIEWIKIKEFSFQDVKVLLNCIPDQQQEDPVKLKFLLTMEEQKDINLKYEAPVEIFQEILDYQKKNKKNMKFDPSALTTIYNELQREGIQLTSFISQGRFGCVFEALYQEEIVAIKCYGEVDFEKIQEEEKLLQMLKETPYVTKSIKEFLNKEKTRYYQICQRYSCNLEEIMKSYIDQKKTLPLNEIIGFVIQILTVFEQMQQKNLMHSDIKPDNILYDSQEKSFHICDFGESKQFKIGTRTYKKQITDDKIAALSIEKIEKFFKKIKEQEEIIKHLTQISQLNADKLSHQIDLYKTHHSQQKFKSFEELTQYIQDAQKIEMIVQFINKIKTELNFQIIPKLDQFKLEDLKKIQKYLENQYSEIIDSSLDQVAYFYNEIKKILNIFKTIKSQVQLQVQEQESLFQKMHHIQDDGQEKATLTEFLIEHIKKLIKQKLSTVEINEQINDQTDDGDLSQLLNEEQIDELSRNISIILINHQKYYLDKYANKQEITIVQK
ncbi:hypothetical protein ABPG74_019940 [Tetrahymena malaccensis]